MISKKDFIDKVDFEDKNLISNIYDKILLCEKINNVVYTEEFYPPNIWKVIEGLQSYLPVKVYSNGVFEEAERRMLAFSPDEVWYYPIELLKIENGSKFSPLRHKDYMGGVMSLGVKRYKLGDFILKDDICYVSVCQSLSEYIVNNLTSIGRNPCTISKLDLFTEKLPGYSFEDINIIITSLRMDSIVAGLVNLSRSKGEELIQNGKVLLDYITVKDKAKVVRENSIITIRGLGKFKFICEIGETNRGRIKALFKKFS